MMYKYLLIMILCSGIVFAVQPTHQYNKIFLEPFYRVSMSQNTNYNYTLNINPPDKITSIKSAIITFKAYITPTITFNLTINGVPCNNPLFTISTTYSGSGQSEVSFDCTNIIKSAGQYNLTLRPTQANTGAVQGWIDLTYMNNPQGTTEVFGTEYLEGDDGTIFLLLKDSSGLPISNATCTLDIYYPNIANNTHPEWINNGLMQYLEEGLYYYDFNVPLLTGLYMVNANCLYLTENNFYYTLESGKSPTRNITSGTYVGDPFVLNDYQEWLYTQCDSSGGGTKICESWYQWNVSSNVTQLFVQYLGENSGANTMIMSFWNWTTNTWNNLSNTLIFKATGAGGVPSGVDEYLSNNVPITAINASNQNVRIRLYTTSGSTFKQWDNWLQLRTTQYGTSIQDLRGSGEIHVSSVATGENRFFKVLTCDGFIDGRCGYFTNDAEYDLLEGEIEDLLNISATSTRDDATISYYTPFAVDCTALYWIKEFNGTDWNDFNDYTFYSQPAFENCIITLHKNITSGTIYQFWFKMDNYMKWEVDWTKKMSDSINYSVEPLCSDRNFTYINPINDTTPTTNDSITDYCYQFMDDQYWINLYYSDSQSVYLAGEYASYVQEMRYYRNTLSNRYMFLILGNNTGLMSDYYAAKVWNNPYRNLTYYENFTILQQDLTNYSMISMDVWNYSTRNLTYYQNFTIPQQDLTNYSKINDSINYNINLSTQVLLDAMIDAKDYLYNIINVSYNYLLDNIPLISLNVWNYSVRDLTYYPNMTIYVTNVTIQNVSVITQNVSVNNYTINVNNYTIQVENVSVITQNVSVNNYTIVVQNYTIEVQNVSVITQNVSVNNYTIIVDNYTIVVNNYTIEVQNYTIEVQNVSVITQNVSVNNYTIIVQNVSINYSDIAGIVWSYPIRNLTYYENFTIVPVINYTLIANMTAVDVWTYPARYVHGVLI